MSAAATPIGATVPRVSYAEPRTGRQDWPGFGSGDRVTREAKHLAAVASTLQWADEAAERGDHVDALAWLETLEAIGDQLPEVYESRRNSWSAQLGRNPGDPRHSRSLDGRSRFPRASLWPAVAVTQPEVRSD
jgi:hypothetical protein